MHKHTNRLIHETSPYLLQHAHNPVDWYPWGEEALQKAKNENRPILVSIGYSACHWCHVMEKESFENEETAKVMNDHFINIKIDREERPDLDHIYMDAIQAMTGSGGWPLNVFLTPDRKPFYGGTYYPPVKAFNRSSWTEVLLGVSKAFNERRHEIDAQAENLTDHLLKSNGFGMQAFSDEAKNQLFSKEKLHEIFQNIMKNADKEWGGFGKAPKFPQTFSIQFLLRYHWLTKNEEALQQALLSIDKMMEGGIYDHLAGGFARYATDTEWLVPHFEKMLYDNGLLITILCEAYQLTKKEKYKTVIDETLSFIKKDMMNEEGGFYSALDADSEGEEGKFYVWQYEEVNKLLGKDAAIFCQYYDITPRGNWEEKNILRTKVPAAVFAKENGIDLKEFKSFLQKCKSILLAERNKRIKPGLDSKILLGWNALMNSACSKAYAATGNESYKALAEKNMHFLTTHFAENGSNNFFHTWKDGKAKYPAFVDDYAFLIRAMIDLYQIGADTKLLNQARDLTGFVLENFIEEETGFFYFTKENQTDVILRKKEVYDGAVPSGNAVMAYNLFHLGIFFDKKDWKEQSHKLLVSLEKAIVSYPSSFGMWTCLLQEMIYPLNEIVILGKDFRKLLAQVLSEYIPHRVVMASESSDFYYPLLTGKEPKETTQIYLCRDYTCRQPVYSSAALLEQIGR